MQASLAIYLRSNRTCADWCRSCLRCKAIVFCDFSWRIKSNKTMRDKGARFSTAGIV